MNVSRAEKSWFRSFLIHRININRNIEEYNVNVRQDSYFFFFGFLKIFFGIKIWSVTAILYLKCGMYLPIHLIYRQSLRLDRWILPLKYYLRSCLNYFEYKVILFNFIYLILEPGKIARVVHDGFNKFDIHGKLRVGASDFFPLWFYCVNNILDFFKSL